METRGVTRWLAAALLVAWAGGAARALAQTAENVAVVINEIDPASMRVGEHYIRQRGIPATNVIVIRPPAGDTIDRPAYTRTIEQPIAAALARGQLQDRILYLVLMKGIPLRVAGTMGQEGTAASVDSELTLLYRRMVGRTVLTLGRVDNPYFLGAGDPAQARPFLRRDHDIYLVSRIDAFTEEDAIALVDRAAAPVTDGRIVLDQRRSTGSQMGDEWLAAAGARLSAAGPGERVLLETTTNAARDVAPVLGYYAWGPGDPPAEGRTVGMRFVPGALAASFMGADARTFTEPPPAWKPRADTAAAAFTGAPAFAGSTHPLIGDLIREGVTGVAGHVSEPYLQSVVRPDVLFPAYLAGRNLVESYYLALPHLSWQSVIVGDPLCAPFRTGTIDRAELEPGIDTDTELPAFFSARRVERLQATLKGLPRPAASAWAKGVGLRDAGQPEAARIALEQAVELAPSAVLPRIDLALLHDANKEPDAAAEQYRRVLALEPNNVTALNNLAFVMAVQLGRPAEARPFADRAVARAPTVGTILDTLGWVEYLLGEHATAATRLADAVRRDPNHPLIRLHAAVAYAAVGARARAAAELREALRLDPAMSGAPEAKELAAELAKPPKD